jgi:paraquat-inducible protein B
MPDRDTPSSPIPDSKIRSRRQTRLSLVWIIPIVAAIIGAWVAAVKIMNEGPTITIVFRSAVGLEAGKTKVRYNGIDVGEVSAIRLSKDYKHVIATVQMAPDTEGFLVEDTRFWAVTPRISGASVTGLSTLISGAYISFEIGKSTKEKRSFDALETPPVVTGEVPGRFFILKTTDLGSVNAGTPVYFRRLKVGEVASYELDKDGRNLTVKIYVFAPYDQYVNPETRFWQASGIDVSLSATGVSVQTQSVLSMLVGGIAFETPATGSTPPPAEPNTVFTLYHDRAEAYRPPPQNPQTYLLVFKQSVRGLNVGAPVEFWGIPIGEVTEIHAEADFKTKGFLILVTITVDPKRLGVKTAAGETGPSSGPRRKLVDAMVARGLRAQLRTGNLLTGALYVAVDFFPKEPPYKMNWTQNPVRFPAIPGTLQTVEASAANLIEKLEKVPYQEIGNDLRKTITGLDQTLADTRRTLDNANRLLEPDSQMNQDLSSTLQEVRRTARELNILIDYLERHPESLIRGKPEEK